LPSGDSESSAGYPSRFVRIDRNSHGKAWCFAPPRYGFHVYGLHTAVCSAALVVNGVAA
jgi:hypothetical protein